MKLAPEWVRTSDPVIRSPARYRWTTAPASWRFQDRYVCGICVHQLTVQWRTIFVRLETHPFPVTSTCVHIVLIT